MSPEGPWAADPASQLLGALAEAAVGPDAATEEASEAHDPLVITLAKQPLYKDFTKTPFWFTAAFDGSLRFSLWLRTLAFNRKMLRKYGKSAHLTYFVNAAFYSTKPGKSDVGKAMSRNEVLVRRALTQQAINEGHDIADHGVGHHDGRNWTQEEWVAEIDRFRGIMFGQLYEPVLAEEGRFAFPRFEPVAAADARSAGAACSSNTDCDSGQCLELTAQTSVCTEPCNLKRKCREGMACGAPMFREDTDVCVPLPAYPIEQGGLTLFNEKGEANRKNPALKPYRVLGYRAPYLAANNALYGALAARGYLYDTSQSASPGPPFRVIPEAGGNGVLEFALMLYPGGLTIPMDYNYAHLGATQQRMKDDYERSLLASYGKGRLPWNVGHHFATWKDGAYLEALEWAVEHVLAGCPASEEETRCPGGEVVSFRELVQRLE